MYYETSGGRFSRGDSITKGTEHLRLAAEQFMMVGHHDKEQGDARLGENWLRIATNLEEMAKLAISMATQSRIQ
jgi:hypothetical protein